MLDEVADDVLGENARADLDAFLEGDLADRVLDREAVDDLAKVRSRVEPVRARARARWRDVALALRPLAREQRLVAILQRRRALGAVALPAGLEARAKRF